MFESKWIKCQFACLRWFVSKQPFWPSLLPLCTWAWRQRKRLSIPGTPYDISTSLIDRAWCSGFRRMMQMLISIHSFFNFGVQVCIYTPTVWSWLLPVKSNIPWKMHEHGLSVTKAFFGYLMNDLPLCWKNPLFRLHHLVCALVTICWAPLWSDFWKFIIAGLSKCLPFILFYFFTQVYSGSLWPCKCRKAVCQPHLVSLWWLGPEVTWQILNDVWWCLVVNPQFWGAKFHYRRILMHKSPTVHGKNHPKRWNMAVFSTMPGWWICSLLFEDVATLKTVLFCVLNTVLHLRFLFGFSLYMFQKLCLFFVLTTAVLFVFSSFFVGSKTCSVSGQWAVWVPVTLLGGPAVAKPWMWRTKWGWRCQTLCLEGFGPAKNGIRFGPPKLAHRRIQVRWKRI